MFQVSVELLKLNFTENFIQNLEVILWYEVILN